MKCCQIILTKAVENMHIRDVEQLYRYIHLSEMYNLEKLKEMCILLVSENTLKQFKAARKIYQISDGSHYKIIELALRRHELNEADEKNFHVNTQIVRLSPVYVRKANGIRMFDNNEVTFELQGKFHTRFQNETKCLKSLRLAERFGLKTDDKNISSLLHQKSPGDSPTFRQ
jgi:hypothetical protein